MRLNTVCSSIHYALNHLTVDIWRQVQLFDNVENCQIPFGYSHGSTQGPMNARYGRW